MIKCTAKTCKYYEEGKCKAEEIELVNHEYYDEEEKEYKDFQKCITYEHDKNWIY
jgi:hypothetical protein